MDGITDQQFESLQQIRGKYPDALTPEQGGALINEFAWVHRSEGLGMQRKDAGTAAIQPSTGIHVWNGIRLIRDGKHYGQDVFGGASVGKYSPVRGETGPADPNTFVAPVKPSNQPEPPPPAPPDDDLKTRVAVLDAKLTELAARHASDWAEIATHLHDLQIRLETLEQQPPGQTVPIHGRFKGRTGRSFGHDHSFSGEVEFY